MLSTFLYHREMKKTKRNTAEVLLEQVKRIEEDYKKGKTISDADKDFYIMVHMPFKA